MPPSPQTHPEILISKRAADFLGRAPETLLTPKQVQKALQMSHDTQGRITGPLSVAQFRLLLAQPPEWLLEHHRGLVAKGIPQQGRPAPPRPAAAFGPLFREPAFAEIAEEDSVAD
ncbi:hypothetical protein [Streptomyces morookaense]|uniref:Uncharacterized protein n=1 Tax=Streptomyces morookaense TaxID=1970 RepID=A0A7Y7B4P7_STRMO|nr:hypothetical protein [Streptomyces morookaense]NVK78551.1 hypothetical protein [Streptomyces morookaense]GHF33245.1 hypothetical protein GCM10010359_39960 [Streptomyces morookaense]